MKDFIPTENNSEKDFTSSENNSDFNPYLDRANFEKPQPNWLQRFFYSIQAAVPSVLVVDISHYNAQGFVDFDALLASGVVGVIAKCSESDWYLDTTWDRNWRAAYERGMAIMPYHFFRGNKIAEVQYNKFMTCADEFLNTVDGNVAVGLDVETVDGVDKDTRASRAFKFCTMIKSAGLLDGIYCSPGLVPTLFPTNDTRWNNLAFQWVAQWTSAADFTLPNGWSRDKVKFWQFGIYPTHSWTPVVNGAGTVDCNRAFFESQDALKAWLGQSEPPIPPEYPVDARVLCRSRYGQHAWSGRRSVQWQWWKPTASR